MKRIEILIFAILLGFVLTSCKSLEKELVDNNLNGEMENREESNDRSDLASLNEENLKENKSKTSNQKHIDLIDEKIKTMSLEEKIGQLFISGFEGETINDNVKSLIGDYKVGGLVLFARNIKSAEATIELVNHLKQENQNNQFPLFLSIDEEGGRVSRLPSPYNRLPTAMELADKGNNELSYELGQLLAMRIESLGLNLNFAPVLDIFSNPANRVIGNRAFGKTVKDVENNGLLVMEGIRNKGIIPTVKHFPGHGDTYIDSHLNLPSVNKTLEELKSFELKPFQAAIEKQVPMIMIAHILYPEIDKSFPASMSRNIITGILREAMDYEGLVISDDMTMAAIINNYTVEEASLEFLKAGGDIVLICHHESNTINAIEKIKEAVELEEISILDIDRKVYRVLKVKDQFALNDKIVEDLDLEILKEETEEFLNHFK